MTTLQKATPRPLVAAPAASSGRRPGAGVTPWLFLAPGMLMFLGAIIYPLLQAMQMSLYDWKAARGLASKFVGFDNYSRAFHDPIFWRALVNSGVYMAITVPIQIVLGLLVAMLLNRKAPARAIFRVLFYLPVVTSWVVVSLLFKYLFADQGVINWALHDVTGLTDGDISWLGGRWTAMVAVSALGIWKGVGWSMMIFLAALQGVPKDLEESAAVDGAGAFARFRAVTLPAIFPAVAFTVVMLVIGGFNVFTSVLVMTDGGPAQQTQVLLTYLYQQAFSNGNYGYGAAIAVLLTAVVFVVSVVQLRAFRGRMGSAA